MKRPLVKCIGRSLLKFSEIQVLIDVESSMNNRPLIYQGEVFEQRVLTPNNLLRERPQPIIEENLEFLRDEGEILKRMKFIQRSKQQLRQRFINEYIHALEETASSRQ